jgi:enoyl-CoA hydratase
MLAAELAALPQDCLRSDRRSAYDAFGLDERAALQQEFAHGQRVLAGALEGAQRFAGGAGRHGSSATQPGVRGSRDDVRHGGPAGAGPSGR